MLAARGVWGAHRETALMRDATHCGASPRAISGVPPEDRVRRDAEHHTRDAYALPRPIATPPRFCAESRDEERPSDAENRQFLRSVRTEHEDPLDIACSAWAGDE
jgi:hypothetical protein